jgi:hypothetical protein
VFATSFATAQDAPPIGKYSGNHQIGTSDVRVALDIKSVEAGTVKGTLERYVSTRRGGSCDGEFPVQGTYKDNKLDVRTIEKVGKASDCIFRLRMNVQGNKLVGNMGKTELTLSK